LTMKFKKKSSCVTKDSTGFHPAIHIPCDNEMNGEDTTYTNIRSFPRSKSYQGIRRMWTHHQG
jgi:hypothetical protein